MAIADAAVASHGGADPRRQRGRPGHDGHRDAAPPREALTPMRLRRVDGWCHGRHRLLRRTRWRGGRSDRRVGYWQGASPCRDPCRRRHHTPATFKVAQGWGLAARTRAVNAGRGATCWASTRSTGPRSRSSAARARTSASSRGSTASRARRLLRDDGRLPRDHGGGAGDRRSARSAVARGPGRPGGDPHAQRGDPRTSKRSPSPTTWRRRSPARSPGSASTPPTPSDPARRRRTCRRPPSPASTTRS